jgi:hypothetical protein
VGDQERADLEAESRRLEQESRDDHAHSIDILPALTGENAY